MFQDFNNLIAVSSLLFGSIEGLFLEKIKIRLDQRVEAATMMRVLSLPASFFKDYSAGDLSNRVNYVKALVEELVNVTFSTSVTSIFSLIYVGQIFRYAKALAVPALLVTFATVLITFISAFMQIKISREQMILASKESGLGYALISGIQKIKLAGAEKRAFAKWGRLYAEEAGYLYNPPLFLKLTGVLTSAVSIIGTIVIYFLAAESNVNVADYYAFNSAYAMVSGAFLSLATMGVSLANVRPTLDMIAPILEAVPEVSEEKEFEIIRNEDCYIVIGVVSLTCLVGSNSCSFFVVGSCCNHISCRSPCHSGKSVFNGHG